MIEATVICDSIGEYSPRLTTFKLKYPRFIHAEFLTHRAVSRNASSSRAISFAKQVQQVRDDAIRAAPVFWGAEQKGMQTGEELSDTEISPGSVNPPRDIAKWLWHQAAVGACKWAEYMATLGLHKSICNRIIEPYTHITVIASATEPGWLNFFGLRLDKAAEPTMRALAEAMWEAYQTSVPKLLQHGQWHLPFVPIDDIALVEHWGDINNPQHLICTLIRVSVARCARVSYESFETGKRSTVEEDLKLYDRLVGAQPLHASPAEHQATPDYSDTGDNPEGDTICYWCNKSEHGNLIGWRQYRKMLPGEAVAPLPEEYRK